MITQTLSKMNLFITHIELDYDKDKLLEEFNSAELIPYTPSRPIKDDKSWFSYQPDWMTLTIDDRAPFPELSKLYDYISEVYGFSPICKFFKLNKDVEIPAHKDMGHKACINVVLSDDPAPVKYKDYGEVVYKNAILNVMKRHSVNPGPERKMIKFQLGDIFYKEAIEIWNTKHSIT